jgi:anhydro-N-acetylmuramic acid kinase
MILQRRAQVVERLSLADGAATLAAFTVDSVAAALSHVPHAPRRWIVCAPRGSARMTGSSRFPR